MTLRRKVKGEGQLVEMSTWPGKS